MKKAPGISFYSAVSPKAKFNELFYNYLQEVGLCSFVLTGIHPYAMCPIAYSCTTCGFKRKQFCCAVCAKRCHKDHELVEVAAAIASQGYCVCHQTKRNHRAPATCVCLPNEAAPEAERISFRLTRTGSPLEEQEDPELFIDMELYIHGTPFPFHPASTN